MTYTYPFTQQEFHAAHKEWGCNCGPSALAFALQTTLGAVRRALPAFDERRYTNPMMMREALAFFGRTIAVVRNPSRGGEMQPSLDEMFAGPMSLVRIQWTGPWTAGNAPARWAARQTHWIACWKTEVAPQVFDCNGGIMDPIFWRSDIVPLITETIPRADGGWYAANVWRLEQ